MSQRVAVLYLLVLLASLAPAQRLRVGFGHSAPMQYRDPERRPAGFAIDVMNEAARRERFELVWVPVGSSDSIDHALRAHAIDLFAAGVDTPQRRAEFFVSRPWWVIELSLLVGPSIHRPSEKGLAGKRLVPSAPAMLPIAQQHFTGAVLVPPDPPGGGARAAAVAVCSGAADAALMTHTEVHEQLLDRPALCVGLPLKTIETGAVMHLAVLAARGMDGPARRLRDRIDALAADGTLAALAGRHPPIPTQSALRLAEEVRERHRRLLVWFAMGAALALLAMAGLFIMRQRRIRKALHSSEARYRGFFESAAVGTALIDGAGGYFLDVNAELCRMTGYSRAELLGGLTIPALAHPDERGRYAELYEQFRTGAARTCHREMRLLRKDGDSVWVRADIAGLRAAGTLVQAIAMVQDITARREAELERESLVAQLSAQKAHLEAVLDQMPAGVAIAEAPSGRILLHNEEAERLLAGGMPEEYPLSSFALRGEVVKHQEMLYERGNGETAHLSVNAGPVRDATGNVIAAVSIFNDISERKRVEQALAHERELFESILNTIPVMIVIADPELRSFRLNREAERLLGWTGGEAAAVGTLRTLMLDAAPGWHEVTLTADDGSAVESSWAQTRLSDDTLVGIGIDMRDRLRAEHALRESRERLSLAQKAARIGTWDWNLKTGETVASEEWFDHHGLPRAGAMPSLEAWYEVIHPDDRDRAVREVHRALSERTPFDWEYRVVCPDQSVRWLHAKGQVIGLEQAERILGVTIDITEQKRAEQTLIESQKMESVGTLAGGVAHDFNNLLTSINGSISLALETLPQDWPDRRLLDHAMQAGERAAGLTRQLLAYAGKGALIRQPVDLSEVAADTLRLLRPSMPPWVEVREELTCGLPPVLMDPSQAQQVAANLLINAAEAIDGHPGAVTVRTWTDRSQVWFEVADTGCGMDQATRARAFEPFFSTKFTGRGLGLAAVKGIVRATGGDINVESAPGEGTRFRVSLPAAEFD